MVDPIGNKAGTVADRRIVPVGAAASITAARPASAEDKPVESGAAELSGAMAAQPPVDSDRVAQLRDAIRQGRYALDPAAVADRLLTLKHEWTRP
jgi:negative regulator of flagellin synthesis FlgM